MNIAHYDKTVRTLYEEHRTLLSRSDRRTGAVARRLLKEAKVRGDDVLAGYAAHSAAFAAYFIDGNYPSFLKHLRLAATHLLRCDDKVSLVHVYYLIAIDALHKGMYDLAHHHFLIARNLAARTGQEAYTAILDLNIGHVLMQTGRYKESRAFFKSCLHGIEKDKTHPHYHVNRVRCRLNDATACLETGRIAEAERIAKKVAELMAAAPDDGYVETGFYMMLLHTRIALKKNDRSAMKKHLSALLSRAAELTQIADYMPELGRLMPPLLQAGYREEAKRLLDEISGCGVPAEATRANLDLCTMRIAYCTHARKEKELLLAYEEQDRAFTRLRAEQKDVYRFVKALIALAGTLQREQETIGREREELTRLAETDVLTELPNRYALNNRLEASFERMYTRKEKLFVGLIDLDDLKRYNDRYGHSAGDALLQAFSRTLSRLAEEGGFFAARYGGDEFVLIGENKTAEIIRETFKRLRRESGAQFSSGFCNEVPDDKSRPWDFFADADRKLYRTKKKKKRSPVS